MADLHFESTLSMEEIERNFKNIDFFGGVMDGLEEALSYERGRASANTFVRKQTLPNVNVADIRKALNMTQKAFAAVLGVSSRTVEGWEIGKSNPSPTAKNLLYLINEDPSLVKKLQQRQ